MGRINQEFLDSVFFIYPTEQEANVDQQHSIGGSGFFVSIVSKLYPNWYYTYAVTNAHVLEGFQKQAGVHAVLRVNTTEGSTDTFVTDIEKWITHPSGDDVAVIPIPQKEVWKMKNIPTKEYFITEKIIEESSIGVGDETITMGRFANLAHGSYNIPAVRFGHVSVIPKEPVIQQTRGNFPQESILVETFSISGFSGAPVFLEYTPDNRVADERINEKKAFLLGIDWGHLNTNGRITDHPQSGNVAIPAGMMGVVPAWKIDDILNLPSVVENRDKQDKAVKAYFDAEKLDHEPTDEDFTRLIATVRKLSLENK